MCVQMQNPLVLSGQDLQTRAKNLPGTITISVHVRRILQYLEPRPPSACFSGVLCSRYTIASNIPLTFPPKLETFFLLFCFFLRGGGRINPNYTERKVLFVYNYVFTSTESVSKVSVNDIKATRNQLTVDQKRSILRGKKRIKTNRNPTNQQKNPKKPKIKPAVY